MKLKHYRYRIAATVIIILNIASICIWVTIGNFSVAQAHSVSFIRFALAVFSGTVLGLTGSVIYGIIPYMCFKIAEEKKIELSSKK